MPSPPLRIALVVEIPLPPNASEEQINELAESIRHQVYQKLPDAYDVELGSVELGGGIRW